MRELYVLLIFIICFNSTSADELSKADSHAPISVMGDHMHKKGEIMFSYRFNHMVMNKIMNGNKRITINSVTSQPNGASNG